MRIVTSRLLGVHGRLTISAPAPIGVVSPGHGFIDSALVIVHDGWM